MASAERFSGYSCKLNNALSLLQMDGWSLRPGTNTASITPAGLVDAAHHGVASAAPVVTFTTRDFATLFGAGGVSASAGLACTAATTFAFQEREDGSTFIAAATNTHETLTSAIGFCYPKSLSASQDDNDGATVESDFVALWNGSTFPVVWNTGQVLTGLTTPAFSSRFFLGPVYHNSAEIKGVTNVSIDFGINYVARAFSGEPFARLGAIVTRAPQLQFTVAKVDAAAALTTIFGSAIATALAFYFRKGVASGTRVADATANHIKVSASAGDWSLDEASVQGNEDGTVTFTARPTTTLATSAASAIP